MKKILTALLALAASASFAQVSLYGNIDQTMFNSRQNGKTITSTTSNGNSTSAWGIKGSEDLGQGLKANFNLYSELTLMTGQASSATTSLTGTNSNKPGMFNRAAYIELDSNQYGSLRVGRQSDGWFDSTIELNNTGSSSFGFGNATSIGANTLSFTNVSGVAAAGLSNVGTTTQNPSSSGAAMVFFGGVSYTSPTIANTTVKLQTGNGKTAYADGEDIGNGAGYTVKYNNGALKLITSSSWKNDTNGNKAWTNTLYGAVYKVGAYSVNAATNKTTFGGLAAANHDMKVNSVGVGYDINSKTDVAVGYTVLTDVENTANKFTQTAVTARYKLSPRTSLYAGLGHGVNTGAAKNNMIYAGAAGDVGASTNAAMLGLKHTF
jgi:predicted porin